MKLDKYKKFFKRDFVSDVAVTLFGNGLAFVISFVLTPFITRAYSPEAYGTFSMVYSIVMVMSVFSTLSFTNALVLAKEKETFYYLVRISVISTITFCLLILGVIFMFRGEIITRFELQLLGNWIFLIPFLLFFISIYQIIFNWNLRLKEFKRASKIKIAYTLTAKGVAILGSRIAGSHPALMVLGELLGYMLQDVYLASKLVIGEIKESFSFKSIKRMREVFYEYREYPSFFMFSNLLIVLYTSTQNLVIAKQFGIDNTGYFSLASSVTNIPTQLISLALAPIFYQKLTELFYNTPERLYSFARKACLYLAVAAIVPYGVIILFGEPLFSFFFGTKWGFSGNIASLLSIYFYFYFISFPFSSLFRVLGKIKLFFYLNLLSVAGGTLLLYFLSLSFSFYDTLLYITLFNSGAQAIILMTALYLSYRKQKH